MFLLFLISCAPTPKDIEFGRDSCSFCKMTLMDPRFGAEIVTDKGKIFIFDDVNCMVKYTHDESFDKNIIAHSLVIDYSNPRVLVPLDSAHFVFSEEVKTPMASKVVPFGSSRVAEEFRSEWNGNFKSWSEIQDLFK
jgi:copper chaperone NosL